MLGFIFFVGRPNFDVHRMKVVRSQNTKGHRYSAGRRNLTLYVLAGGPPFNLILAFIFVFLPFLGSQDKDKDSVAELKQC